MAEPFEYAIKKDVRNNPIVREVDEARHRDLWKSVLLAGLFVGVLMFAGLQRIELLQHGFEAEQLQRQLVREEEITRQLKVEIEKLSAPDRIEQLATQKLRLVAPTRDEATVIERAIPVEPPAGSVVARR